MIFKSLASSSHGNAYIVDDGETRILLECGISHRRLQKGTDFQLSSMAACLISHEHKDHAAAVRDVIKDGIPVFLSDGTADALDIACAEIIEDRKIFTVGTMDIMPFSTFHDAAEPLGFLIRSRKDGESLAFATDTVNLRYKFKHLTILAIEANYDRFILERCEKMPEKVRHRIINSHMEIDTLCDYLKTLDLRECREIWLLHLSDATSHEDHFINKVARCVPNGISVKACGREESG